MKRMNGAVTLSFVEEDNKQRVIFRVVPLCTLDGVVFQGKDESFPDAGSLRVVPDKREQSTFKERMREMGSLCVIDLQNNDGKELVKIRQNRNYDPAHGEFNQYAIYSDVVEEFAPEGAFEVWAWGEPFTPPAQALTQSVLILANKVLYGPVAAGDVQSITLEELKPFGNDRFLLHTVELSDGSSHTVYWNPEATVNWRQRRGNLRRKIDKGQRGEKEALPPQEVAEQPTEPVADAPAAVAPGKPLAGGKPAEVAAPIKAAPVKEPEVESFKAESAKAKLPIGRKLEILDTSIPFEQQISRLELPISESANRLTADSAGGSREEERTPVRYAGTPFVRDAAHMPKTISRPEPLQHVVEQQIRSSREERISAEVQGGAARVMENPVDSLLSAVDAVWQDPDMKEQAITTLLENQGFTDSILQAFYSRGQDVHALAAATAQLEDIEAERLSLLMQLEQAKEAKKRYQEKVLAEISQKRQEEIAKLSREIQSLAKEKEERLAALKGISEQTKEQASELLTERLAYTGGVAGWEHVLLSPAIGVEKSPQEMLDDVRLHLCSYGFPVGEDDAMILLIAFSLFSSICFYGKTIEDAQLFATAFMEALGLQGVSVVVDGQTEVQVVSLVAKSEVRTPTVTIQRLGTNALPVPGHKTIFLVAGEQAPSMANAGLCFSPAIRVPAVSGPQQGGSVEAMPAVEPVQLSSLLGLTAEIHPLLEEGERWFEELQKHFEASGMSISDAILLHMRRFVAISSRKIRGGFLAAADAAICQWIVPGLLSRQLDAEAVQPMLNALPRALQALTRR